MSGVSTCLGKRAMSDPDLQRLLARRSRIFWVLFASLVGALVFIVPELVEGQGMSTGTGGGRSEKGSSEAGNGSSGNGGNGGNTSGGGGAERHNDPDRPDRPSDGGGSKQSSSGASPTSSKSDDGVPDHLEGWQREVYRAIDHMGKKPAAGNKREKSGEGAFQAGMKAKEKMDAWVTEREARQKAESEQRERDRVEANNRAAEHAARVDAHLKAEAEAAKAEAARAEAAKAEAARKAAEDAKNQVPPLH